LGVDKKVTKADLKKAFKELAKKYHPDKIDPKNKDDAEKNFAEIANAYETLKDEKLK
jgi:DnaJ-class molecular chaperone